MTLKEYVWISEYTAELFVFNADSVVDCEEENGLCVGLFITEHDEKRKTITTQRCFLLGEL